jgi:hypothetical protein
VRDVAENIRIFDQAMMKRSLEQQLFRWYLDLNGLQEAHAPTITWGGLSEEDSVELLTQVELASKSGLTLTDEGVVHLNQVTGLQYQYKADAPGTALKMLNPPAPAEDDADAPEDKEAMENPPNAS